MPRYADRTLLAFLLHVCGECCSSHNVVAPDVEAVAAAIVCVRVWCLGLCVTLWVLALL